MEKENKTVNKTSLNLLFNNSFLLVFVFLLIDALYCIIRSNKDLKGEKNQFCSSVFK